MKRIAARFLIALLTFALGVAAFDIIVFLCPPLPGSSGTRVEVTSFPDRLPHYSSRYENPVVGGGLLRVVREGIDPQDMYDGRSLVISYDGKPLARRPGDLDAPRLPGFYLSDRARLDFERVEVIGSNLYFKTRGVNGVSYEFSGSAGHERVQGWMSEAGFVKGVLKKVEDGKLEGEEEIKFR